MGAYIQGKGDFPIFGICPKHPEDGEVLLSETASTREQAERFRVLLELRGCTDIRICSVNGTPPDFIGALNI